VNRLRNFRWVLAIVMIASLVMAPLSRPAMAATPSVAPASTIGQVTSHTMAGHDMMTGHAMSSHQTMPMADLSGDHLAMLGTAGLSMAYRASASAAHEMPCCPAQAPMAPDCDKCLSMALCLAKYLTGMPSSVAQPMPLVSSSMITLRNEAWPDGLGHPPPEHPPRS
jgi:hypothetical protein